MMGAGGDMKNFVIIATFCALSLPAFAAGDAAAGKDLYMKKCKACHAEDGAGSAAMQKKYAEKWKALGGKEVQAMKDADLAKAIQASASHKALAKTVTEADLNNLVAHIRTLKK
jgi:mono/diheme cytochrome c family protein